MIDVVFMSELADLFNRTVSVDHVTRRDSGGRPLEWSTSSYSARIVIKGTAQRTLDGTVILGRGTVDLLTTEAITTTDRLTLPSEFPPVNPPILSVRLVDGEVGALYTQLVIG